MTDIQQTLTTERHIHSSLLLSMSFLFFQVLMDGNARQVYNSKLETALADDDDDYTGESLSKWMPTVHASMAKNEDPAEDRAVFVVSRWLSRGMRNLRSLGLLYLSPTNSTVWKVQTNPPQISKKQFVCCSWIALLQIGLGCRRWVCLGERWCGVLHCTCRAKGDYRSVISPANYLRRFSQHQSSIMLWL